MAFTIPDNDEAFNTNQSIIMQTDINAVAAGIGSDGVYTGCAVSAQGSPDMTVAVAVGTVRIAGAYVSVTAGNVNITAADATNPRIDLISVNSSGTKAATDGTAAANPKAPDIPASSVLLAMIYVPANDTTIASNQITDKRAIVPPIPFAAARLESSGGTIYYSTLGFGVTGQGTTGIGANQDRFYPFTVPTTISIDLMAIEVTTASAGGTTIRMAIYQADTDWQPTALVVDAGTVAADSTGVKTASVSATLTPGRYLGALNSDAAPTIRVYRGVQPFLDTGLGTSGIIIVFRNGRAYAAFPASGTVWTTIVASGTGIDTPIVYRVSTP